MGGCYRWLLIGALQSDVVPDSRRQGDADADASDDDDSVERVGNSVCRRIP